MTSKKVTVGADGTSAVVVDAKVADIVTTVISTETALTGTYGLVQKLVLVGLGMAVQNNRLGNGWNPINVVRAA